MRFLPLLVNLLLPASLGLRPHAAAVVGRRAAIASLATTLISPLASRAADLPANAGGALGATCLGFGCNPYGRTDFDGMPKAAAPENSLPYADFLDAMKNKKVEGVVFMPPMGDERPTAIMDRMLALLPDDANREQPGFLFRTLFLRKLPADIRYHLIALKEESMRSLAEKGDVLWSTRPSAALHSCIEPTDEECMAVAAPPPRRGGGFCWYHATYGKDASKCRTPCSWKAGNGRGGS